jgi:hypothetical protein
MAWKSQLIALCFGAVLAFFAQSMFCFAEDAGLVRCGARTEQHERPGDSAQSNTSPSDCCHIPSRGSVIIVDTGSLLVGDLLIDQVRNSDDIVPDGQVHEIDLPPQLS